MCKETKTISSQPFGWTHVRLSAGTSTPAVRARRRGAPGAGAPAPVFLKQTHPLIIDPGYIITGRSVIAAGNWKRPVCCFLRGLAFGLAAARENGPKGHIGQSPDPRTR